MSSVDDYFLATFLKVFHFTYTIIVVLIRIYMKEFENNHFAYYLTNQFAINDEFDSTVFFWSSIFPGFIVFTLIAVASFVSMGVKIKHYYCNPNVEVM